MMDYDAFATPFILLKGMPMYQVDMEKLNDELNITPNFYLLFYACLISNFSD